MEMYFVGRIKAFKLLVYVHIAVTTIFDFIII